MTFQNQVVLITGGSSGIGLVTARAFAGEGANVWLVARNPERLARALEDVKASCRRPDQNCGSVTSDVANPDRAAEAVAEVTSHVGLPDIVVNSHGVTRPGHFQDLDLAVFREMMEINYFGALHVIMSVMPGMIKRRSGHIVNVASGAALLPTFGYTAYTASKYALRGLSDVLRLELKPHGVRISLVCPPDTNTPMVADEMRYRPPETQSVYGGTLLSPEFVARTILSGVRRNRYSIVPGLEMSSAARAASLIGDLQFTVLDQLLRRARTKNEHPQRQK